MSAKVDQTAAVETHRGQNSAVTSSSMSSVSNSKASMYKGKAGFVIPKNKFSGSLVPIFKGGKKSETDDTTSEESKQMQRKTKWGVDLTQDTGVRRGRAFAYQTRVDQITQQLKLGSLSANGQNSKSAGDVPDGELPSAQVDYEKLQALEFERREAIEEILKLNPSYKAPSDYQPVMREATVPVPVKEHPGYNFVGLIYGPDGDTHKRLEKDTGTKIQVYGTKSGTEEKVEITASYRTEIPSFCSEVYVQISAETFEKVDAAAALIEMLLSTVSGNSATPEASTSLCGDNPQVLSEVKDMATVTAGSTSMTSQELVRPVVGPASTSSQGNLQPYPGPWFPTKSELAPVPSSMAFTFNPPPTRPMIGPRPATPYGFDTFPQSIPVGPSRLHPPMQIMPAPVVPLGYPLGQNGPPRNHATARSPSLFVGQQPIATSSPRVPAPQLVQRALTPTASSPGWAVPPADGPQPLVSGILVPPLVGSSQGSVMSQSVTSLPAPLSVLSITTQAFPSAQAVPTSASSFVSSQIQFSSAMPAQSFVPQAPLINSSTNTVLKPAQTPVAPPSASYGPQSGMPSPAVGSLNAPSFTPLKPMGGAALRPPLPGPSDFTFQQHLPRGPSHSAPGPGVNFTSQRPPPAQLPPSQVASFRPALQNTTLQHVRPNFSRPQMGNQMGPPPGLYGASSPNRHLGPRNLGPAPQMPSAAGPFPPRAGHSTQYQHNYPVPPLGSRPGSLFVTNQLSNLSGRPPVYDPFSPTSVSAQGSNIMVSRKQESDPEYEDLMASVGVK